MKIRLSTRDEYAPMPVPQIYWSRFEHSISIMLWVAVALYRGIDPAAILRKGPVSKSRQYEADMPVHEKIDTYLNPEVLADYKWYLNIAAEHLLFSDGLSSPSPVADGARRKVTIIDFVEFVKNMGWPDTEGLRRLIALTTASPQIPGSKKLPHKKGTHWSDEELKALAQRKKKLKHARITHVAEKLAYEYGCTAALIRMRAKEGEELLEQEKEQEKPIWLHAPSSIARKTTK